MAGMDEVFEYYPRAGAAPRYISASRLYGVLRAPPRLSRPAGAAV